MRTNEQILSRMAEDLKLRGLATGTQRDYFMHARIFLEWANRHAEAMDEEDIRQFLNYLISDKKLAASTINTYNAALRFLFAVTLNRNLNYRQIPRLKQTLSLPVENGIIHGNEHGDLMPHKPLSREQMVVIAHRYIQTFELRESVIYVQDDAIMVAFFDYSLQSRWAWGSVEEFRVSRLINVSGYFRPLESATRAEGLSLLTEIAQRLFFVIQA